MPRRKKTEAEAEAIEQAKLDAEELANESDEATPRPGRGRPRKAPRRVAGDDFLGQDMFVGLVAPAFGWLTGKALGPTNAMNRREATKLARSTLRVIGRHVLKHVDVSKLARAEGDMGDAQDAAKTLIEYIARRLVERQRAKEEEAVARPRPAQTWQEPEAEEGSENGHQPDAAPEDLAATFASMPRYAAGAAPYLGQEA